MKEITRTPTKPDIGHVTASFTCFPLLPTELRLKIWQFCVPGPRTVQVECSTTYQQIRGRSVPFVGWISSTPPPTVLHICHESRAEGLKTLKLALGTDTRPPTIYLNFDVDTLHLGNFESVEKKYAASYPLDMLLDGPDDTHLIQKIKLDIHEDIYGRRMLCWEELILLTGLKTVELCNWDIEDEKDDLMIFYAQSLDTYKNKHEDWVVPQIWVVNGISGKTWGRLV